MASELTDLLDDCVSVPKVAEALKIERWGAYDLVHSGQIPAVKAGRNWLIRRQDAVDFCANRAVELRTEAFRFEQAIAQLAA